MRICIAYDINANEHAVLKRALFFLMIVGTIVGTRKSSLISQLLIAMHDASLLNVVNRGNNER